MGRPSSYEQVLIGGNGFAGQFEPHEQDYLYRKGFKGAPIPVSAAERDGFVKAYNRAQNIAVFTGVVLMLVGAVAVVTIYPGDQEIPDWTTAAMVGVVTIVIFATTFWNWYAPARALRGRGAVGRAKTAAEARRDALARTSYRQFALAAGIGLFLLFKIELSGWNKIWLAGAALLVVGAALRAYRKWRSERLEPKS